jgi:hypothetical protein
MKPGNYMSVPDTTGSRQMKRKSWVADEYLKLNGQVKHDHYRVLEE